MKRVLICLLALLLAGCQVAPPEPQAAATPSQASLEPPAATEPAAPPAGPTEPPTPTATAAPSPSPTIDLPPPAAGDLNVLLLGSDSRANPDDLTWRTDTLIVVAIRPRQRLVGLFSIPRDLWVTIPGYGENRINTADYIGERENGPGGGPALVGATLEQNLGIHIDAYARIDFAGLERLIDTLGGITVTSDRAIDEWMDAPNGQDFIHVQVKEGTQRMDGATALGYARWRTEASDLDRTRRQQQILLAVRDAALRPEMLPKLPSLLSALSDTIDTDLGMRQVLSLLALALQLKPQSYRTCVFDMTMVQNWTTPEGAMVLLPQHDRIQEAWRALLAP